MCRISFACLLCLSFLSSCGDADDKSLSSQSQGVNSEEQCEFIVQNMSKCQPGSDDHWAMQKASCLSHERVDAGLCVRCLEASLDTCENCFWICNPRPRDWDRRQWLCEKIVDHQAGCFPSFEGTWDLESCGASNIDVDQCAVCLDSDGCRAQCPECDVP